MTNNSHQFGFSVGVSRLVIPFRLSTFIRDLEEQCIVPSKITGDRFSPDCVHLLEVRVASTTFPLTYRGLMNADYLRENALGHPEDVRSNVLDGAHMLNLYAIWHYLSSVPYGIFSTSIFRCQSAR